MVDDTAHTCNVEVIFFSEFGLGATFLFTILVNERIDSQIEIGIVPAKPGNIPFDYYPVSIGWQRNAVLFGCSFANALSDIVWRAGFSQIGVYIKSFFGVLSSKYVHRVFII